MRNVPTIGPWGGEPATAPEATGRRSTGRRRVRSMTTTGRCVARLEELGLTLYGPHPPHDPLDAVVVHGGTARTSGQLPRSTGRSRAWAGSATPSRWRRGRRRLRSAS